MIPADVERRARWVLDTLGARDVGFGDDVPFREEAWAAVARGERPNGDDLAEAFWHLARLEEVGARRDEHGRFRAAWSALDPLDPPLERLRQRLGVEPPRWRGARFAVALTHDVDSPWRWTRRGVLGAAARLKGHALGRRAGPALRARLARSRVSRCTVCAARIRTGASSACSARSDGAGRAPRPSCSAGTTIRTTARRRRRTSGCGLAWSRPCSRAAVRSGCTGRYRAAGDEGLLATERDALAALAGDLSGQRYHYLRVDPHANLAPLAPLGFRYDTTLGFPDALGFRAGSRIRSGRGISRRTGRSISWRCRWPRWT